MLEWSCLSYSFENLYKDTHKIKKEPQIDRGSFIEFEIINNSYFDNSTFLVVTELPDLMFTKYTPLGWLLISMVNS